MFAPDPDFTEFDIFAGNPFITRMSQLARLEESDKRVLAGAAMRRSKRVRVRGSVAREGEDRQCVFVVLDGFACRYKMLKDGRRQVIGFLLPGDICDCRNRVMPFGIETITVANVAELPSDLVTQLVQRHPRIGEGLTRAAYLDQAITVEWLASMGQRRARERLAHLFCEFHHRMDAIGYVTDGSCELPVSQTDLADTIGLSPVHINRTLQILRGSGLVSTFGKTLVIHDLAGLQKVALFSPAYLQLGVKRR